jgi:hypothetical protein
MNKLSFKDQQHLFRGMALSVLALWNTEDSPASGEHSLLEHGLPQDVEQASLNAFTLWIRTLALSSNATKSHCLLALKYLDKFHQVTVDPSPSSSKNPNNNNNNPHEAWSFKTQGAEMRLLLPAFMLADSYLNDVPLSMGSWSLITKLPIPLCIRLRRAFLESIQYDLVVPVTSLEAFESEFNDWLCLTTSCNTPLNTSTSEPVTPTSPTMVKPLTLSKAKPSIVTIIPSNAAGVKVATTKLHETGFSPLTPITPLKESPRTSCSPEATRKRRRGMSGLKICVERDASGSLERFCPYPMIR